MYMIFAMTHGVQGSYTSSILTTLERKFNLPSVVAGTIVTISTLGYLLSALLVSFFLPHRLRVRAFACSMLCTGLCSIFYFLPHFLYPTVRSYSDQSYTSSTKASSSFVPKKNFLCASTNNFSSEFHTNSSDHLELLNDPNWGAVVLFSLSEILQGVAGAPIWTIGVSMVDDHTHVSLASKLIGMHSVVRLMKRWK